MVQLHNIKPQHKRKTKKRVGRGGKRGTYSGKGMKGQKSRAGKNMEPIIRGLIKKYPKLRGYRFSNKKNLLATVNLDILEKNFKDEEIISPESLLERGIVRKIKERTPAVKILSKGELTKKLTVKDCLLSKTAEEKIKKAGGEIIIKEHHVVK